MTMVTMYYDIVVLLQIVQETLCLLAESKTPLVHMKESFVVNALSM